MRNNAYKYMMEIEQRPNYANQLSYADNKRTYRHRQRLTTKNFSLGFRMSQSVYFYQNINFENLGEKDYCLQYAWVRERKNVVSKIMHKSLDILQQMKLLQNFKI